MWPLKPGYEYPRNQWYVAGWSHELNNETPVERWFLGEPVALYRDKAGKAIALEGRCPHRNYPLAKGIIRDDALECGYHGFTFASDGRCVRIPSQEVIPAVCRVKAYPLVEKWQWLWIWMGDPDKADESLIPDHDEIRLTSPGWVAVEALDRVLECRPQLLHENLTDISHLAFLHAGTIGTDAVASTRVEVSQNERFLRGSRRIAGETLTGFFSDVLGYDGTVERVVLIDFYAPSLHVALESFRTPEGEVIGEFRVHHAVTPAGPGRTNYFLAWSRSFALEDQGVTDTMNTVFEGVIQQDVEATEAIEAMVRQMAEPKELLVRADDHSIRARRWIEELIEAER
ncbi:MAG: Rieske 2Fe-2S domain-containing protein [Polymorphobacter sp.]|uniref:Rieske 2Fe-2S domain-containing protein n=1 Tax=Polymorphobacter sp. TaxID=1909290 RepID=UPI003A886A4B